MFVRHEHVQIVKAKIFQYFRRLFKYVSKKAMIYFTIHGVGIAFVDLTI